MNFGNIFGGGGGIFGGGGLPTPPMPPGLPSLPGLPGLPGMGGGGQPSQGPPGGLGGTMQTQDEPGYQQNLAGLLQMMGGNQVNPANMNLTRGGLI